MKKSSGIALITLIITVLMLSIITGAGIGIGLDSLKVKNINNLYTDIKILNDSVASYYNQYGALPLKEKFTGNYEFAVDRNPNDDPDNYYVIDINKLGYISLTNNVKWTENDVYIINTKTHTIYYPEGIKHDDENYYRLPGEYSLIVGMDIVMSYKPETLTNGDVVLSIAWPDNTDGFTKEVSLDGGNIWYAYTGDITIVENCTAMARVRDTLGATIAEEAVTIMNIDKMNPTVPTIAGGGTSWSNGVTITVTGSDSDIQYYEYYISTTGVAPSEATTATGKIGTTTINTSKTINDRNYEEAYIYIRAVDDANNKSSWSRPQMLNIDIDKPTISVNPDGKTGYVMPTTGTATIKTSATADDNGGSQLAQLYYAWSQNETSSPTATSAWTSFTNGEAISKTDITQPGTWYLWVSATDGAGNLTETRSGAFVVSSNTDEKNLIKFEPQIEAETWTNDPVDVKVNFGENIQNNQTITVTGTQGTDYTIDKENNTVTIITNNQTITVTSTDSEGNKVEASYTVDNIDLIPPTMVVNPTTGNSIMPSSGTATVTTTVTASDEGGSGVDIVKTAWSRSATIPPTEESEWSTIANGTQATKNDISGASTWYLWVKVTDKAGNTTEGTSGAFVINPNDSEENRITITPDVDASTWTKGPVYAQVVYGENLTSNKTITVTGQEGTDYTINTETNIVTIITNNQTITATAEDAYGNEVQSTCIISNIDSNPPTVTGNSGSLTLVGKISPNLLNTLFSWNKNGSAPIESVEFVNETTGNTITEEVELPGGTNIIKCTVTKVTGLSSSDTINVLMVADGTQIPDGESIPSQYVARIGNVYYTTVQSAINAVPTTNTQTTVVLLKNVEEDVSIAENQNVVLDLNGNTISYSGSATIVNYGTAKIQNGTITTSNSNAIVNYGTMELPEGLTVTGKSLPSVANMEGATLNITGSTISSTTGNAVQNEGILNINGNTQITSSSNWAVYNEETGTTTISSGKIGNSTTGKAICNDGGTVIIEGTASITGAVANEENGVMNVSGGDISTTSKNSFANYGELNISGTTTISSTTVPAIYNYDTGTLNITAGKITSTSSNAITNKGTAIISGNTEITSNSSSSYAVHNYEQLTINGGTIINTVGPAIKNEGTAEISGEVEITSNSTSYYGVHNTGEITITGATIDSGNGPAIGNTGIGIATISGNTKIICNAEKYPTVYNAGEITIIGGEVTNTAGPAIQNEGTAEISGDVKITSNSTSYYGVYNTGNITINGGTIDCGNGPGIGNTSSGIATISGNTKITSNSTSHYAVSNMGEITISGANITNTVGPAIKNEGTAEISSETNIASNSTSYYGVYNTGNITINGGTINCGSGAGIGNIGSGVATISGNTNVISSAETSYALYNTGEITISGAEITVNKGPGIGNTGTATISGETKLTSNSTGYWPISNSGTLTISGGTFTAENISLLNNTGTLDINGTANLTTKATGGAVIVNAEGATATIVGATLTSEKGSIVNNSGTMEVGEECTFISNTTENYSAITNNSTGELTITGGTYQIKHAIAFNNSGHMIMFRPIIINSDSTGNAAIVNNSGSTLEIIEAIEFNGLTNIVLNYGNLTISCGAILHSTGDGPALTNYSTGTAVINGGTIISEKTNTINNMGTLTIEGTSQITSTGEQAPTLYNTSGTTTINGGVIENTADGYAIYKRAGEVIINGGTIITKTNLGSEVVIVPEGVLYEYDAREDFSDVYGPHGYIWVDMTIPSGITVLKIDYSLWCCNGWKTSAGVIARYNEMWEHDTAYIWSRYDSIRTSVSDTFYVGVTPGKKYLLGLVFAGLFEIKISCSDAINQITPTVTDY